MKFNFSWQEKTNGVSKNVAKDVNDLAAGIVETHEAINKLEQDAKSIDSNNIKYKKDADEEEITAKTAFDELYKSVDATNKEVDKLLKNIPANSGSLILEGSFTYSIYFDIRSDSYFEVCYGDKKEIYPAANYPDKVRVTIDGSKYPCDKITIRGYITTFWSDTFAIRNVKAENLDSLKEFKYNNWHGDEVLSLDGVSNLELLRLVNSPINKVTAEKFPRIESFIKLNNADSDLEFKPVEIAKKGAYFKGYKYGGKIYKPGDKMYLDGTLTNNNIEPVFQDYDCVLYVDEVKGDIQGDGSCPQKALDSFKTAVNKVSSISKDKDVIIRLLSDVTFTIEGNKAVTMLPSRTGTVTIEAVSGVRRKIKIIGTNWYADVACKTIFRNIELVGSGDNAYQAAYANAGYFTSLGIHADVRFENVVSTTLPIVSFGNYTIEGEDSKFGMIRYGSTGWNHGASVTVNGNVFVKLKNCTVNRLNSSACGYTDGDSSGNYGAGTINGSMTIVCDNSNIKLLTSPSASKPTTITNGLYLYSLNGSTFPDNDFVVTNGTHNRTLEIYGGWAEINPNNQQMSLYSAYPRKKPTVEGDYGTPSQVGPFEYSISDGVTVAEFNRLHVGGTGGNVTVTFNPSNSTDIKGSIPSRVVFFEDFVVLPDIINIPLPESIQRLYVTTNESELDCSGFYNLKELNVTNSQNLKSINIKNWDNVSILELTGVPFRKTIIESLPINTGTEKHIYIKDVTQSEIASINVPAGWIIEDNTLYDFKTGERWLSDEL